MDLKEYYRDLHSTESRLAQQFPDGVVYVTSIYHRERNSKPGQTLSATWLNAARVITDGTHRLAKQREVQAFLDRQENNRAEAMRSEQLKKQQYIVVLDPKNPQHSLPPNVVQGAFSAKPGTGSGAAVAVAEAEESDDEPESEE